MKKKHKLLILLILIITLSITSVVCYAVWRHRESVDKQEVQQSQTDEMNKDNEEETTLGKDNDKDNEEETTLVKDNDKDNPYTVEIYTEDTNGDFVLLHRNTCYGAIDTAVTAKEEIITGYELDKNNDNSVITDVVRADGSTVLKLYYVRKAYTITYIDPETDEKVEDTAVFGDTYTVNESVHFTKHNYKFVGWLLDESCVSHFKMPANDVELKALFSGNEYEIEYVSNSGSLGNATGTISNQNMTYDKEDDVKENCYTLDGYVFDGWNTKADGTGVKYTPGQSVSNLSNIDGDTITFYAQWIPATDTAYKVTAYQVMTVNNGAYEDVTKLYSISKKGTTGVMTNETAEDKTGFTTVINQTVIAADGSAEVTIYYVRNKYTLTWNLNGSTAANNYTSGSIYYGDSVVAPNVTKIGYVLSWSKTVPDTMGTENLVIDAVWTPATDTKYTVNYLCENLDGNGYTLIETEQYSGTTDTIVGAPVKEYEGFTSPGTEMVTILPDGTAEVNYRYTRNTYTITYTVPGSNNTDTENVKYGANHTLKSQTTLSKTGYTFEKWVCGDIDVNAEFAMPAKNLTISSTWIANSYTVQYISNVTEEMGTVTGSMENQNVKYDIPETVSNNQYEIAGYTFTGWNTKADGTGTTYLSGGSYTNLTSENGNTVQLYAIWSANTDTEYLVKIYVPKLIQSGSDSNGVPVYVTGEYDLYWDDRAYGTTGETAGFSTDDVYFDTTGLEYKRHDTVTIKGDGSTVLNVYYARKQYDVVFDFVGGTPVNNKYTTGKIYYGASIAVPTSITKSGYTFKGWREVYSDDDLTVTLTAEWKATPRACYYTKRCFVEKLDGTGYELYDSATTATDYTADEQVTDNALALDGFTVAQGYGQVTITIKGDNSAVMDFYYSRNSYELSYDFKGLTPTNEGEYTVGTVKFGQTLVHPVLEKDGYTINLYPNYTTMPASDTVMEAVLTPHTNIKYTIQYYTEDIEPDENGYPKYSRLTDSKYTIVKNNGTTDQPVDSSSIDRFDLEGFTYLCYDEETTVKVDGSTIINVYYRRNTYQLSYDYGAATVKEGVEYSLPGEYKYGESIHLPKVNSFGESDSNELSYPGVELLAPQGGDMTMPAEDLRYVYRYNIINFNIKYIFPTDLESEIVNADENPSTFNVESEFSLVEPKSIPDGYTFVKWVILSTGSQPVNVVNQDSTVVFYKGSYMESGNDTLEIVLVLKKDMYEIPVELDGGTIIGQGNSDVYKYPQVLDEGEEDLKISDIPLPKKEGYMFTYWSGGQDNSELDENLTLNQLRADGTVLKANWIELGERSGMKRQIIVNTVEDLRAAPKVVERENEKLPDYQKNDLSYYGYKIQLNTDLELSNIYEPVIDTLNCEIYGNNHTINFTSNNCMAPLIGTIGTDGRIEDLSITGTVDITSTSYTGPNEIAMISYVNKGLIKNVHAKDATILANTLSEGRAAVFSVEGQGGTFFGCTTNNVTVKGYDYVGCIVAYGNGVNVQWCDIYNTSVYGHSYVGLLAGCTTGTYMYCNVGSGAKDTCHVSGYEYVGGAFGYIEYGSVYTDQCHVHNVNIIASDYVGGYIGVSESKFNTALNGIRSYICDVNIRALSWNSQYVGGVIGEYQTDLYEDEDEGEIEDKRSGFCIYMRDVVINSEGECRPVCGNTENEDLVDVYRAYNIKYNGEYYIKTS